MGAVSMVVVVGKGDGVCGAEAEGDKDMLVQGRTRAVFMIRRVGKGVWVVVVVVVIL